MIYNIFLFLAFLVISSSAGAVSFVYTAPVSGQIAPVKVGEFSENSPSNFYSPSLYMAGFSLGRQTEGDSVSKIFTIKNTTPYALSGISVVSLSSGASNVSAKIACTPPATLNSATTGELCDVIVTLDKYDITDEDLWVTVRGNVDSFRYVESTYMITSYYYDPSISQLVMSPGVAQSFSPISVNQYSSPLFVSLSNIGEFEPIYGLNVITDSPLFNISNSTCSDILNPQESCNLEVTFKSPEVGEFTGTLAAYSDNASNGVQSILLTAEATGQFNIEDNSSGPFNFELLEGQTSISNLNFSNIGNYRASNVFVTYEGDGILAISGSNSCGDATSPIFIEAGASCSTPIQVSALTAGSYSADAIFNYEGRSISKNITLKVNPADSVAHVSPSVANFGSMTPNTAYSVGITLSNVGFVPTSSSFIEIPNISGLTILSNLCGSATSPISLGVNQSCYFSLQYTPSDSVDLSGNSVAIQGFSNSVLVPLQGVSSAATAVASLSAGDSFTIDFGSLVYDPTNSTFVDRIAIVTNNGNSPLTISGVSGLPAGVTLQSSSCSNVPAGNACSMSFRLNSNELTSFYNAKILFTGPTSQDDLLFIGSVVAQTSIATVTSGSPINFGSVSKSSTPPTATVSIRNDGNSSLTISSVSNLPSNVSVTANSCSAVPVSGSCSLTFRLATGSLTSFTNTIAPTVGASTNANITMTGSVTGAIPQIVSGSPVDFGSVQLNAASPSSVVTLKNIGNSSMTLSGVSGLPANVTLTGNTCSNIAVSSNCTLAFSLATSSLSTISATATTIGAASGSDLAIPISGSVVGSVATTISGTPVNFGSIIQGSSAATASVSIQNTGNSPLTISSVTGLPSSVSLSGNSCVNIAINGTCSLTFSMVSTSVTSFSGVSVSTQGASSNATISMSGTVIAATYVLNLQSSTLTNYGALTSPSTVASTFVFVNGGNSSISSISVTLSPAVANFSLSANTCSGTLAPNATCSVTGTYGGGATATTLTGSSLVISGSNSATRSVALTGSYTIASTIKVVSGISHSCALLSTGVVKCWGQNGWGQLGNNTLTDSSVPVQVSNITTFADITASSNAYSTCGVTKSGAAYCWGANGNGQLGDGTTSNKLVPTLVSGLSSGVSKISAGTFHSCAALSSGAVRCWGSGGYGKLGNNSGADSYTPVTVSGISTAIDVSSGESHSCSTLSSGAVRCWGRNNYGQLGNNSVSDSLVPVAVSGITSGATKVSAGTYHSCALQSGSAKCWGSGGYGKLGNNSTADSLVPVQVSGITSGATDISAGVLHSCASHNGAAKCWGGGGYGKLGNNSTADSLVPVQVSGITSGVISVTTATYHSCSAASPSSFKCWGSGGYGKLGNGSVNDSLVPVTVTGP